MGFFDGFVCKTLVEGTVGFIIIHQLNYLGYCWVSCFGSAEWSHDMARTTHFHLLLHKALTNKAYA